MQTSLVFRTMVKKSRLQMMIKLLCSNTNMLLMHTRAHADTNVHTNVHMHTHRHKDLLVAGLEDT